MIHNIIGIIICYLKRKGPKGKNGFDLYYVKMRDSFVHLRFIYIKT